MIGLRISDLNQDLSTAILEGVHGRDPLQPGCRTHIGWAPDISMECCATPRNAAGDSFHEWENGAVRMSVAQIYLRCCSVRQSEATVTLDRMIVVLPVTVGLLTMDARSYIREE